MAVTTRYRVMWPLFGSEDRSEPYPLTAGLNNWTSMSERNPAFTKSISCLFTLADRDDGGILGIVSQPAEGGDARIPLPAPGYEDDRVHQMLRAEYGS